MATEDHNADRLITTSDQSDFGEMPDSIDPVRFYLRNAAGEIIACGCSFPFPHDEVVVSQTTATVTCESLTEAKELVGAERVEMLDEDLPGEHQPWFITD